MAATITLFQPSANAVFQFQATLDGAQYTVRCPFNAYGQRYYVEIRDQSQTTVLERPMIASPPDADISLTAGYFTTPMVFRESSQSFEVG